MKATLTFNLPDEKDDLLCAQRGSEYLSIIQELDEFLRSKIKYAPDDVKKEVIDTYQEVRDFLTGLKNDIL